MVVSGAELPCYVFFFYNCQDCCHCTQFNRLQLLELSFICLSVFLFHQRLIVGSAPRGGAVFSASIDFIKGFSMGELEGGLSTLTLAKICALF